jgi:hypothetical protein
MRTAICGAGVLAAVGLCACNGQLPGGGSAPPTPAFELSVAPGAANQSDAAVRVNVSTGQAWVSSGNTFTAITEPAGIPAGDYHLSTWGTPDANGKVAWNTYRFDRKTGHTWVVSCTTLPNCSWTAVTP